MNFPLWAPRRSPTVTGKKETPQIRGWTQQTSIDRIRVRRNPVGTGANTVTFTASLNYFFVVYTTDTTNLISQVTGSDAEVSSSASGWSIDNGGNWYVSARSPGAGTWAVDTSASVALVQVNGA